MTKPMLRMRFSATAAALGALAISACLSNSSNSSSGEDGGAADGSSSSSSSGSSTSSSGSSSSSGGSGSSSGDGGSSSGGSMHPITPDANGYCDATCNDVGIVGAWYAYGDDWGTNGRPPGNCEMVGMHMASQCSQITSPAASMPAASDAGEGGVSGGFPNTGGKMCLSGTAAKVINGTNNMPDYSNIFGLGIGLDFANMGGVKMSWDSTATHVIGFSFTISGLPTAAGSAMRVEFPTTATDPTGDAWAYKKVTADGNYTVDLTTAASDQHGLVPSFTPAMGMNPAFTPKAIESIQFHIVTDTMASYPVANFCVSNLTAITM